MAARDVWDDDVSAIFLNTGEFAETVTYNSPRDSITSRSVSAVVFDSDGGRSRNYTVMIGDDPDGDGTGGVSAPRQGATLTLSGGEVLVIQGFSSDEGMHTLLCVKPEAST